MGDAGDGAVGAPVAAGMPFMVDGPFEDNQWRRRSWRWQSYSNCWTAWCSSTNSCCTENQVPSHFVLDLVALAADPRWGPVLRGPVLSQASSDESSFGDNLIGLANGSFTVAVCTDTPKARAAALAAIKRVNLVIRRHISWAVLDCNDVVALQDVTFKHVFSSLGSVPPPERNAMNELLAGLFSAGYVKSAEILTASLLFELQMLIVDTVSPSTSPSTFAKVCKFGVFATQLSRRKEAWMKQCKMQTEAIKKDQDLSKQARDEKISQIKFEPEPTMEDMLRDPSTSLRQDHDAMFGGLGGCAPMLDEVAMAFYRRFVGEKLPNKHFYSATKTHDADFFTLAVSSLLADADHPVHFTCTVPDVGPVKVRVLTCIGLQRLLCLAYGIRVLGVHGQTLATLENGGALSEAKNKMGESSFSQEHMGPLDDTDADAVIRHLNGIESNIHAERETFTVCPEFVDTASEIQKMYTRVLVRASVSAVATLLGNSSWKTVWEA